MEEGRDLLPRQLHRTQDEGWVDSMVEVANACNKLFTKHTCGVCNIYTNKQVEFESRQERNSSNSISPVDRVLLKTGMVLSGGNSSNLLDVDLYRQFLFDEESVVSGVSHRETDDDTSAAARQRRRSNKDELENEAPEIARQRTN